MTGFKTDSEFVLSIVVDGQGEVEQSCPAFQESRVTNCNQWFLPPGLGQLDTQIRSDAGGFPGSQDQWGWVGCVRTSH